MRDLLEKHPWVCLFCFALLLVIVASVFQKQPPQQPPTRQEKAKRTDADLLLGALSLKQAMRDPESFSLSSVFIADKSSAICYEYRARNGFNGLNVEHAVFPVKGPIMSDGMGGFAAAWNKQCAHQTGNEEADKISLLMKLVPQR